jgi:hypothetical protein
MQAALMRRLNQRTRYNCNAAFRACSSTIPRWNVTFGARI